METQDLFITPIYLVIFYLIAYAVRGQFTNSFTRAYFIPALTLKFVGAIALGLVYMFYYGGGDTFTYHRHATLIYNAFGDSFDAGLKLMMTSGGAYYPQTAKYTSLMIWYVPDSSEYLLSRFAAFWALFCFNTYTVIGLFFAVVSFTGLWAMFITFIKIRPQLYKEFAIAIFFTPSNFFWGSGLLKDSLCLGALGWLFYAFHKGAIQKRNILWCIIVGGIAAYALVLIKVYIILCFLPAALLWVFNANGDQIKNSVVRFLAKPVLILLGAGVAYFAATNLTKGDDHYDIDKIGERSKITADYLYEVSVRQNGSGYHLGEQDGTIGSMAKLAPQAIVVSLFRPFLWEVHNPVMLLSALEATFFLLFTLRIFWRVGVWKTLSTVGQTPILVMCFTFSLIFAASVGVTSSNFGTLVRYKIPLIPFYLAGLYILQDITQSKINASRPRKLATA
jgi:hypothetical protein